MMSVGERELKLQKNGVETDTAQNQITLERDIRNAKDNSINPVKFLLVLMDKSILEDKHSCYILPREFGLCLPRR